MNKVQKIISDLSKLMDKLNLTELEYSNREDSYKLKKNNSTDTRIQNNITQTSPNEIKVNNEENIDNSLKAPLVGTVYLSPEPGAKQFVETNQVVEVGQVLLIIEAMKTMNEITAHKSGKISKIFVNNAEPVEFGEPLILIE